MTIPLSVSGWIQEIEDVCFLKVVKLSCFSSTRTSTQNVSMCLILLLQLFPIGLNLPPPLTKWMPDWLTGILPYIVSVSVVNVLKCYNCCSFPNSFVIYPKNSSYSWHCYSVRISEILVSKSQPMQPPRKTRNSKAVDKHALFSETAITQLYRPVPPTKPWVFTVLQGSGLVPHQNLCLLSLPPEPSIECRDLKSIQYMKKHPMTLPPPRRNIRCWSWLWGGWYWKCTLYVWVIRKGIQFLHALHINIQAIV